jgi:hypothetical protein
MPPIKFLIPPAKPGETAQDVIAKKHQQYYSSGQRYKILYYATRLMAGLCAGILPFVVSTRPGLATGLSIAIVVVTVFDTVFNPKEKWKTLSRATDLLYVADLKRQGKYKEFEEALTVILSTEEQQMLQLLGLDEVIKKAKESAEIKDKPGH